MTARGRSARRVATGCAVLVVVAGPTIGASPAAADDTSATPAAASDTATVDIAVNTPPRAGDDRVTTWQDVAVTVDLLANDVDPDGDPLSLMGATSAGHGLLSFVGGTVTYTPDAGFAGIDEFTYLVSDGRDGHATGQVRVTVVAPTVPRPHPVPVPRPVEEAHVEPTAGQPPAPALGPPTRQTRPVRRARSLPPRPATGPLSAPTATAPAAVLPFTGTHSATLTLLGAGLLGVGGALCLLGRCRPTG